MAEDSLTGIPVWNTVTSVYLIFRAFTMVILFAITSVQTYYEYRSIRILAKSPNARIFTLIGITGYSISRLVWCFLQLFTYRTGYGSYVMHSTTFATFFLWTAWLFIGCFWLQLLYTFFIDHKIRLENSTRIWRFTWVLMLFNFIYLLGFNLIMIIKVEYSMLFYTVYYFVFMGACGIFFLVNGIVLTKRMDKHLLDKQEGSEYSQVSDISKKTKILVWSIVINLVGLIGRDLIYFALKIGMEDNLRHLSTFITYLFEMFISCTILYAIAQYPLNYFLFKPINICRRIEYLDTQQSTSNGFEGSGSINTTSSTIDRCSHDAYSMNVIITKELDNNDITTTTNNNNIVSDSGDYTSSTSGSPQSFKSIVSSDLSINNDNSSDNGSGDV